MKSFIPANFIVLFFVFTSITLYAQTNKSISGQVLDTAKVAIEGARVMLVDNKDTLKSSTDKKGNFYFSKVKSNRVLLQISSVGYKPYDRVVDIKDKEAKVEVLLKSQPIELDEVVVKARPNPIKVMQDTVEYNAAAFDVFEGDNIADLIKQFPGLEVDENYNVKTNGESVVKLRVNGEDFFTSNVSEFLAKLPAEIVSKIQIIDDFGDQANFTGVKTGEPSKMINIVTKEGLNKGRFGDLNSNNGTNSKIAANGNLSLWEGSKQNSYGLGLGTENNGAGRSRNFRGTLSRNNKFGKMGRYGFGYSGNMNDAAFTNERHVETVSSLGTYYNNSTSSGDRLNSSHAVNASLSNRTDKWFYNANASVNLNSNSNLALSDNDQYGVVKQRFKNNTENKGSSPNMNFNLDLTRKLKGGKNHLTGNFSFSNSHRSNNQSIITNTLYYDQEDGSLLKDSLLNRAIESDNSSQNFSFSTNYSFGLGKPSVDTRIRKSLNLNYRFSLNNTYNKSLTNVYDELTGSFQYVDSLSSIMTSLMIDQSLGLSYNLNKEKTRFVVGVNLRPVSFQNEYANLGTNVTNSNLNYSPTLNFNRELSKGRTLSLDYSGSNNSPSITQLQPIRQTQNLQNIIVGNPDLKGYFQHRLSSALNMVKEETGASLMLSANGTVTQNEIVNNVIILPDTLGSYKRETRFVNTNGTYITNGNYNLNIPIKDKPYSFTYSGSIGYSKKALFIDSERYFNSGLNFSQQLSGNLRMKKVSVTGRFGYNQTNNNTIVGLTNFSSEVGMDPVFNLGQYTASNFFKTKSFSVHLNSTLRLKTLNLNGSTSYSQNFNESPSLSDSQRSLTTWNFSLNGQFSILKSYRINFTSSQRLNSGYALASQNPLLINLGVSKLLLKNKALQISANVTDLLKQGDMLSRQVAGNAVIDSKSNTVTQVFSLNLRYAISRFGDMNRFIRVDPD